MEGNQILILDIETAPSLGYTWGKWEQDVIEFERGWYIMSFAAKWLNDDGFVCALPDFKRYKEDPEDDSRLVKEIWRLLDECEICIAHNGKSFDIKKIYSRFLVHGLPPPSPFKIIDTKIEVKKVFGFLSNKLDDLGQELGIGRKLKHEGFDTWKGCMKGDTKSWELMKKYNYQDVVLLEKVYLKLRPYMRNHPNLSNLLEESCCPNCGGKEFQRRGYRHTQTMKYQRIVCKNCWAWSYVNLTDKREFKPIRTYAHDKSINLSYN